MGCSVVNLTRKGAEKSVSLFEIFSTTVPVVVSRRAHTGTNQSMLALRLAWEGGERELKEDLPRRQELMPSLDKDMISDRPTTEKLRARFGGICSDFVLFFPTCGSIIVVFFSRSIDTFA